MLPNQVRQQVISLAVVSVLAGVVLTMLDQGFPSQLYEIGAWAVVVLVMAVVLFVASGLLPFIWFAATRFQPRSAGTGIVLWWLILVGLAAAAYFTGFSLA